MQAPVDKSGPQSAQPPAPVPAYSTPWGEMYQGFTEDVLVAPLSERLDGKVQLLFTSPPFPLNRKKRYGNKIGADYVSWLGDFALTFRKLLKRNGSLVIELGNAWEPGKPTMSTLALQALLNFVEKGRFQLIQQFVVYNPARLPSPAQWVNVERIRVKDAFTHIWWMARGVRPKADNKQVLVPYSKAMEQLLNGAEYNSGERPSQHRIGATSFRKNNGGAIPSNVITATNTSARDAYLSYCKVQGLRPHPARMPANVVDFFIRMLTASGDLVLDPFGGSNTTGARAEALGRRWVSIEPNGGFVRGSYGRFDFGDADDTS